MGGDVMDCARLSLLLPFVRVYDDALVLSRDGVDLPIAAARGLTGAAAAGGGGALEGGDCGVATSSMLLCVGTRDGAPGGGGGGGGAGALGATALGLGGGSEGAGGG